MKRNTFDKEVNEIPIAHKLHLGEVRCLMAYITLCCDMRHNTFATNDIEALFHAPPYMNIPTGRDLILNFHRLLVKCGYSAEKWFDFVTVHSQSLSTYRDSLSFQD